jgi:hypothetical protein
VTWLRVDDGFANHPKVAQLSDKDFRVWMRTLCYCARYQDPSVDAATAAEVTGLTPAAIRRFSAIGLLDEMGGMHEIHDWTNYIPKDMTGADRQARWRARHPIHRNGSVTA